MLLLRGIEYWPHAEFPVQIATVLLRDIRRVDKGRQCAVRFLLVEDEDLRGCDRVEPSFDPAPNSRKE